MMSKSEKPDFSKYEILLEVEELELQIKITGKDPLYVVEAAGNITTLFRVSDLKPTIKILP